MGKTKHELTRQHKAATVEYVAFAFDERGMFIDSVRFLSTPVIHVNGPGLLRFKSINTRFVRDFKWALEDSEMYKLGVHHPCEATVFRVDPDGSMRAVLRWIPQAKKDHNATWKCIKHVDCWLTERSYGW